MTVTKARKTGRTTMTGHHDDRYVTARHVTDDP